MAPPGVEDPALARIHKGLPVAAEKPHAGVGQDRDMDADPLRPVVVCVDMGGGLALARDPHQPGPPDRGAERGKCLLEIGAARQVGGRPHWATGILVGRVSPGCDKRQRTIALVALGVAAPVALGKLGDLGLQPARVKGERQADKFVW
jgi:hypothetical protein